MASIDDDVWFGVPQGDRLYLVSNKNAPRFRVLSVSAVKPDLSKAKVVLAESRSSLFGPTKISTEDVMDPMARL